MLSSVQIFNLFHNLREDHLQHLEVSYRYSHSHIRVSCALIEYITSYFPNTEDSSDMIQAINPSKSYNFSSEIGVGHMKRFMGKKEEESC